MTLVLTVLFVFGCVLAHIYREDGSDVFTPLEAGKRLAEYFDPPIGACESKEIFEEELVYRSRMRFASIFGVNILLFWAGAYTLSAFKERVSRLR